MMKTSEVRERDNVSLLRSLDGAGFRALLGQGQMRSRSVIIAEIQTQQALEVRRIEHDEMIQALTANRPDQAFDIRILPG